MNNTALCVLAGGQSRRFGSPKTDVTVDGTPICAWLLGRLRTFASHSVLSTAIESPSVAGAEAFDQIIADQQPHAGPLAGMHSVVDALSHPSNETEKPSQSTCDIAFVIFITADMPLVSSDRIHKLVETVQQDEKLVGVMNRWPIEASAGPSQPHRGAGVEPFPSVWRIRPALALFDVTLASGVRGPHRLAESEGVACLPIDEGERREFSNINTPEDFAALACDQSELRLSSHVIGTLRKP